jgi:hypothetical protein
MKKKTYLVMVAVGLVLASLACSSSDGETESAPPPVGVLFQDDFSDTSSGWDRVDVPEGVTDYEDGVYRIYVNTDNTDVWANPGLNFSDSVTSVEATKVGGPDDNDFGLICRYEDESNFYFFIISSDGFYGIGRVVDGLQEIIGEEDLQFSEEIKQGNVMNVIQVACVGNELTLSVNSMELISVIDSTFSSGDVGLLAGTFDTPGTDIHFDNLVVRKP